MCTFKFRTDTSSSVSRASPHGIAFAFVSFQNYGSVEAVAKYGKFVRNRQVLVRAELFCQYTLFPCSSSIAYAIALHLHYIVGFISFLCISHGNSAAVSLLIPRYKSLTGRAAASHPPDVLQSPHVFDRLAVASRVLQSWNARL